MKINSTSAILLMTTSLIACSAAVQPTYVAPRPQAPAPAPQPQQAPAPPARSTDPAITAWRTAEFNRNWGLGAIRAEHAYAEGFNGTGEVVGFVDFNFDFASDEVNYHIASLDKDPVNVALYEAQIEDVASTDPHGYAVAVVAAAVKNDVDTHGVAYGAQVLAVDYFSGVYNEDVIEGDATYHVSDPYTYIWDNGARVVNISIGYDEEDFIDNPPPVGEKYVTTSAATFIELGGLLVAAAGNDGDPDPMVSDLEILRLIDELSLPGGYIIVGSVDEDLNISSFSDRAGTEAMNSYLVAPGRDVVAPWTVDGVEDLYYLDGTSFAAPHVAGAAAIIFGRWPFLTGKEVADILLTTATDLGDLGVDRIYGHGLLNLENAISPQGDVVAAIIGASVPVGVGDFAMVMGTAFGDASPVGLSNLMAQDKYGRDFYYDLSTGVHHLASVRRPVFEFLEQDRKIQFNQWQLGSHTLGLQISKDYEDGFIETQSQFVKDHTSQQRVVSGLVEGKLNDDWQWKMGLGAGLSHGLSTTSHEVRLLSMNAKNGYLSNAGGFGLVEHELSDKTKLSFGVDISSNTGLQGHYNTLISEDLPRATLAMQINYQAETVDYALRFGQLIEEQSVLGSRSFGGFAVATGSITSFVGVEGNWQFNKTFELHTSVEAGMTSVTEVGGSYFEGFNNFISSSWNVRLRVNDVGLKGSGFVLSASQPLRVENATLTRHQATGLDQVTGAPIYEVTTSAFAPTGRELAFEAAYVVERQNWSLQASLMQRFDAGHASGVSDTAGLIWLKRRF